MKATYTKPEILTVEIELGSGAVICASRKSIFENPIIAGRELEED